MASTVGGRVILDGEDLLTKTDSEMRRIRGREIGMIPQDPHTSLNPVFTIGNQLREALHIQDPSASRKSLKEMAIAALRAVRVAAPEHRVNTYPHQMSGGMKQRVVGAIAISGRPKVIIADEPTTALDVTIQLQYLKLLEELQAETGIGILFITHDFGIVARLCHPIVVMYGGRIVEIARSETLFESPKHPYTEALLSAALPSHPDTVHEEIILAGEVPSPIDPPSGCGFNPRCHRKVGGICETTTPPLLPVVDPEHQVACHIYTDEQDDGQRAA